MRPTEDLRSDRQYERLLYDGISAAKTGDRILARSLLNQAIQINGLDARPYVWLSSITDDLSERRQYLEQAVAIDPTHAAARRGLALLNGMLDETQVLPEGAEPPRREQKIVDVQAQVFLCPQCGGHVAFSMIAGELTCNYCGHVLEGEPPQVTQSLADRVEQVLDFVLPTTSAHCWAEGQRRLACERCGAVMLLSAEEKSIECPYCASQQFVAAPVDEKLIDPQLIILMRVDERNARDQIKKFLGKGFFAPDDLGTGLKRFKIRPAFYSGWTFDGTLEVNWACEVKEGSGRYSHWEPRTGVITRFFDDILISGVRALDNKQLAQILPFNLQAALEFKPEYLVGWPTLIYDRSLSDASLLAREQVTKKVRGEMEYKVEPGREKRNLSTRGSGWSGMTYKHFLFPMWTGSYTYRDKVYTLLVNGQTGKVGGLKPTDPVKIVLSTLIGLIALFFILWLIVWFWNTFGKSTPLVLPV